MNFDLILSVSLASLNYLPIKKEVIQRYNYFRSENKRTEVRAVCKMVLVELKSLWESAGIPIQSDHSVLNKLFSLNEKVLKFKKIIPQSRQGKAVSSNILKMSKELNTLFDISTKDCQRQLSRSFDPNSKNAWQFLLDQRKRRKKTIENMNYRTIESETDMTSQDSTDSQLSVSTVSTPTGSKRTAADCYNC